MAGFTEWSNNRKKELGTSTATTQSSKAKSFTEWSNEKNNITTPQTYRNHNTAFESSGKSRGEYDSSVRQNYAARAAASEPALKTSGGYYSQPTIGADLERYGNTVSTYESALQDKVKKLETANDELERLNGELTAAGAKMESLHAYTQNSTIATGLFNQAQQNYIDLLGQYEEATKAAEAAYNEYQPAYQKYTEAVNAYETYRTEQQGIYDSWRGTIRDADAITQEMASVDAQIEQLEQQQKELNAEATQLMNKVSQRRVGYNEMAGISQQAQEKRQQANALQAEIDALGEMKTLLAEEKDWAEYFSWEDYRSAEDFADRSKYVSTYQPGTEEFNAWSGTYTNTGFGDINYDYINRNETALGRQNVNDINLNLSFLGLDDSERQEMTDEEIALFNYLYALDTERGDAEHSTAYAYIDYLTSDLNYRQRKKAEEDWASYAAESPVGSSVFSVLTSPLKGLSYLGQFADYAEDGEIDQNEGYNKFSYMNTAIRNEVSDTIEKSGNWGSVGSFAYNTGMSMADFLFNTAITGGFAGGGSISSAMALGIMGTGAAADTVISAKDRGLDDGQAFALGTIAGAAEILTEKFSMDALLKGKWEESAIKYILKNAVTEGSEEVGADVINLMADILIAKEQSQWQAAIDAYVAQGKTENEAFGLALADQAAQMGLDFLGGALSGGTMASAGAGIGTVGRNAAYRQTGASLRRMGDEMLQAIIDTGLQTGENTEAHQLAAQLQEKLKNGTVTDEEIGKLFALASREVEAVPKQEETAAPVAETEQQQTQQQDELLQPVLPTAESTMQTAAEPEMNEPLQAQLPTAEQTELQRTAAMYGVAQETVERVQRIADIVQREIVFYDSEDAAENGYRDKNTGILYINARSQNPVAQIISHELTHSLEQTGSYQDFQNLILNRIQQTTGDLEARRRNKEQLYARHGHALQDTAAIDQEIVAEYVEKNLLTDEASIRAIVQQNKTVGQRILSWLNDLIAKLGNKDAQQRAFLTRARDLYASALQESQTSFTQETAQAQAPQTAPRQQTTAAPAAGQTTEQAAPVEQTVDTESDEYLKALREQLANGEITEAEYDRLFDEYYEGGSENQYSFGGRNANAADLDALHRAQEMEREGVAAETIFRETGWYTGADGKWRFEIDDSGMQYNRRGEDAVPGQTLADFLKHDELFRSYPQLRKTRLEFADLGRGINGQYNTETDTITLSNELRDAPEGTLIHEIQHAIQKAEGFASGANTNENIVKAMYSTGQSRGEGAYGMAAEGLQSVASPSYQTVEEIRADSHRLGRVPDEELNARKSEIDELLADLYEELNELPGANAYNIPGAVVNAASERYIDDVIRSFEQDGIRGMSEDTALRLIEVFEMAAQLPTEYFEAKPERVVNFEDAAAVLAPDNTSIELLAQMRAAGMNVVEYEAGNDTQRLELINSLNAQFSIGGRTGAQKQEVLANLRRYMNGEMSTRDIRNYIDGLDDAGYNQPINLQTYEQSEAQEIVDAAHGQNMSVQEYLNYNWEQFERDGRMNDAAREALQLERQQSRRQYSMDGDTRSTLPVNAQQYLRRAERALLDKVSTALSVPAFARREYLQDIVREISDEYLASGTVRQETIDRLFETAYEEGIVVDDEYYREYKHIKDHLRTQAVTISEQDKHNIADWGDFRKSAFGSLRIVNDGGLPVDVAYQELQGMAGELFPEDITHPADQLVRMFEVARSIERVEKSLSEYYGRDAAEFKRWAKNDFDTAVHETMGELKNVRRYAEERTQTETQQQLTTQEDVAEAYKLLKEARRTYEKAAAKNLLTDRDNVQVGRLLKGEIELEHLDPAKDNIKGITAVYEAKREYERLTKLIKEWNNSRKAQLREQADEYLQTANDWKDKKAGILYSRETMERNILDIVKDKKLAKDIIGEYFTPVHEAQAKATKLKNKYRERVKALNLSTKETRAMQKRGQVSEAHAVQLIGEAMDNIRMLENSRGRMEQRDGKTLSDWRGIVQDLWAQNPQLDKAKIEHAIEEFRKIYDELFQMMNDSRLRNGYEPVNYRKGYFPHFQPGDGDGIMGLFGRALGISTDVAALPTTINGLTHTFKPGIQWFGNAQERLGFNTAYDAVEGFDKYIEGVADVIYQTDNIQRLRALATQTRYRTGEEGIRKQVDAVYADPTLSEQDKQNRIEKIFESGRYALSNFVVELEEYTNLLANKKSRADRNMEQALGRDMYNLVKALESRVAANMVAVNPASWLTNFIPLTQGGAQLNRGELLRGMWQTLRAYKESDGIVDASTFLTNRRGSDPLVRTWAQKASAKMSSPMEFIDQFTADSLVRARYHQNLKQGLSEAEAMSEADSWVAGVMADRSKGSTPTLFQRSNPLTKVFTQFQLEVNNQLSYLFKDMPRDQKDRGLAALAAALIKFFLGAWLYDEVYEYFIGRRPALDPIGILNDTVGDITGYELPNLVELGVGAVTGDMPSFRTEKQNAYDTATNLLTTTAEELPFIGGILGGGRVPISSALPDWDNLLKTVTSDTWSTKKKLATAGKELLNPASYLLLPFGGGQLKKIYQGLDAVIKGGSYSVDAEGNDLLQYPVFNDNPWDTAVAAGQAMLFGKTSLETGRDWIESGFKTFGAKETAAYQAMTDAGVPDEDAYDLLLTLRGAKKTETESEAAQERRLLQEADISGDGKSVVYYGLMASDKERELMDAMTDMDADMGTVTQVLMDVKNAGDLTGAAASNAKRTALAESALTDTEKQTMYRYLFGTKQEDGTYTTSRDDDIMAFEQAGLDMDTFLQVQNEYSSINEEYGGAGEKATEFSHWVNSQDFAPEQAAVVKDCFTYYSQIPAEAARYEKFVAAGLEDDAAYELANTINALEPMDGKDSVTDEQKWRAVVDSGMTADEQLAALEALSTESQYRKFSVAYDFGVVPDAYVTARETMPKFDADGNGSYKNDEITAAINSLGTSGGGLVLPGGDSISLTNDQKAALWQLLTGSTSAKNNPYSTSVGWAVIDAVNAMKEGNTGIVLPDGTNYTGGIVLPEA